MNLRTNLLLKPNEMVVEVEFERVEKPEKDCAALMEELRKRMERLKSASVEEKGGKTRKKTVS